MHLIIDCETSGFYNASLTLDHPQQGRIIQLAALLLDEELNEVGQFSSLIYPTTWVISPGAQAVHGIAQDRCDKYGIPIDIALAALTGFFDCAEVIVAHNYRFDSQMLQNEGFKLMNRQNICTMLTTTNLCHIPNSNGRSGNKWPKLREAMKILLNEDLIDAHDALKDCRGCAKLYKYLLNNGLLKIAA